MYYVNPQRDQNKIEEFVYITTAAKLTLHVESNVPEQETIFLHVQRSLKNFLSSMFKHLQKKTNDSRF